MKIEIEIPNERIMPLFWSFAESTDPVTRGWCGGINLKAVSWPLSNVPDPLPEREGWYSKPEFFAEGVQITVEVIEDYDDKKVPHAIQATDMARGLGIMAMRFPSQFNQIAEDNIDAPCADLFIQCVLFGDEKYA